MGNVSVVIAFDAASRRMPKTWLWAESATAVAMLLSEVRLVSGARHRRHARFRHHSLVCDSWTASETIARIVSSAAQDCPQTLIRHCRWRTSSFECPL